MKRIGGWVFLPHCVITAGYRREIQGLIDRGMLSSVPLLTAKSNPYRYPVVVWLLPASVPVASPWLTPLRSHSLL